ncbi:hypothetical protein DFO55_12447 [Grimontella sp. AG753]|nr:hypothetical protein DFO55_12447 [Grimontella sp. AG753]
METDPIMFWQSVILVTALVVSTVYYIATDTKK